MKSMYERVLEEFLLQEKNKECIKNFMTSAPKSVRAGYLRGTYRAGTAIVRKHYVTFDTRGIEVEREESELFTWQQVADVIMQLIAQGRYGQKVPQDDSKQMSIEDFPGVMQ